MLLRIFRSFARELTANTRLRWGVWLILGLVLGHVILVQSDRLAAVRIDHRAAIERLRKAEAVLEQRGIPALLEAEREAHRKIRSMYWQAKTEGLAEAKLQAALGAALNRLGLTNIQFRSGSIRSVPDLPGVWRVQLRLDARFRPGLELRIVNALAAHSKMLFVDRLDLRGRTQGQSYLLLIVSSYFVGLTTKRPE